jgi:GDP-D-mannose 3',5'-epimerase
MPATALVTGAGGFIGHHLVRRLVDAGHRVRGVDLRPPDYGPSAAHEFALLDLRRREACEQAVAGVEEVYALAADMGGIGYVSAHHADILRHNLLIDVQTLEAARQQGVRRYLVASSACVYPAARQATPAAPPLREEEAYPADPPDAYGWEKLMAEQLGARYREAYGIETCIVRLHNVFGPLGAWEGGREKAPAAICRKVAVARLTGQSEIEVWGDGEQARSFLYIDDGVTGLVELMRAGHPGPVNLGQDRSVTIDELVALVSRIAGIDLRIRHVPGPVGVRGRNSDNALLRTVLGWQPQVGLEEGLSRTYRWIESQVRARLDAGR